MEIALNKESKRKTQTIIAYRDGVRSYGEDAANIGLRFPANSYMYLTDLLGKTVDNPVVELYKKRFPQYEIVPDPERNTVVFATGDQKYSVEELIAQLIQKARDFAEDSAGKCIERYQFKNEILHVLMHSLILRSTDHGVCIGGARFLRSS